MSHAALTGVQDDMHQRGRRIMSRRSNPAGSAPSPAFLTTSGPVRSTPSPRPRGSFVFDPDIVAHPSLADGGLRRLREQRAADRQRRNQEERETSGWMSCADQFSRRCLASLSTPTLGRDSESACPARGQASAAERHCHRRSLRPITAARPRCELAREDPCGTRVFAGAVHVLNGRGAPAAHQNPTLRPKKAPPKPKRAP
jgi:hypothetical protein